MMILKPDVALERPALNPRKLADLKAVQLHCDLRTDGVNLKAIPLPKRLRVEHRRRREQIYCTRHVKRIPRSVGCRIISSIVNLNLVALIDRQSPIVGRIAVAEYGKSNEHSRVIRSIHGSPLDSQV